MLFVDEERTKASHRSDRFQDITANNQSIVIVGSFGVILNSFDGGDSWNRQQLKSQPTLIDVVTCPDESFAALGLEGVVLTSSDNGESWESNSLSTTETPQAIECAPDGTMWVVGSFSTFSSSANKGQSWQEKSLDEDMILSYVAFFDSENGLATGEFGSFLKTTDGGLNWEMQNPMPNEFYPIASLFIDMNHGWVAGLSGKILYTEDGGDSWLNQHTDTLVPLYGLSKNDSKIYAVGALGTILVKDLDGLSTSNWQSSEKNKATRSYLRASLPIDNKVIFAGGSGALFNLGVSNQEKKK